MDVLIVGAGPAGLSAALAATERGLSHLVLEQEGDLGGSLLHYPRRKMVLLQPVDLPLHGRLVARGVPEGALPRADGGPGGGAHGWTSASARRSRACAASRTASSRSGPPPTCHWARSVILAVGRRGTPRKLDVPGEELPKVMYRLIDAESYRGQKAAGGGRRRQRGRGRDRPRPAARQRGHALLPPREAGAHQEEERGPLRAAGGRRAHQARSSARGWWRSLPDRVRLEVGAEVHELPNDYVFVFAGRRAALRRS